MNVRERWGDYDRVTLFPSPEYSLWSNRRDLQQEKRCWMRVKENVINGRFRILSLLLMNICLSSWWTSALRGEFPVADVPDLSCLTVHSNRVYMFWMLLWTSFYIWPWFSSPPWSKNSFHYLERTRRNFGFVSLYSPLFWRIKADLSN